MILAHSWPLTGRKLVPPFDQLITQVWVDGFFVISGFLITGSWVHNPRLREYAAARALRIFPGLWVCLLVVAFVIAPIGVAIQGDPVAAIWLSLAPVKYVLNNGLLNFCHVGIAGTPTGVPWPGVWDGQLWTLAFEVICYVAVAVAGLAGLKRRWPAPLVFVVAVAASALLSYPVFAVETIPQLVARFAVVFARHLRSRLPAPSSVHHRRGPVHGAAGRP